METKKLATINPEEKKGFETMHELLNDAEKYINKKEIVTAQVLLSHICEYIESFKSGFNSTIKSNYGN